MFIAFQAGPVLAVANAIEARPSLDVTVYGESGELSSRSKGREGKKISAPSQARLPNPLPVLYVN